MENITIFPMSEKDLNQIEEDYEYFENIWSFEIFRKDFGNTNYIYYIAKCDDKIVGFISLLKVLDEITILNIVTRKDFRKRGIASSLLLFIIDKYKKDNISNILLEVNVNNLPAILLYKKFNFETVGVRKKYYNNTDDAILMTLHIK